MYNKHTFPSKCKISYSKEVKWIRKNKIQRGNKSNVEVIDQSSKELMAEITYLKG